MLRLYYTDADRLEFDATVTAVHSDGHRVYLDRTAFYPTSGGQPHDTGALGGIAVVDVVDEGDTIAHVLAAPLRARVGATVTGSIDATRRLDHMQQHTGQHLLSAAFADLYGAGTLSVHFGADESLIELSVEGLTREQVLRAEARANEIAREARPVRVTFEDAAAVAGLRKPSDRAGELRIVSIEGLDRSACGGTHVSMTAAVAPVLLRGTERIRGRLRVAFLCGIRAVVRAREEHELLARAAQALSAAPTDLPAIVAANRERLATLERDLRTLGREHAGERARRLHAEASPEADGRRIVRERLPAGSGERLRLTAQAMSELPGAVYVGSMEEPPMLAVAAGADTGLDAAVLLKRALAEVGGRGGGSPRIAQGTAPDGEALRRALATVAALGG